MKKYILLILVLVLSIGTVFAQNKTALVIGNGAYFHFSRLANPANEAVQMKNTLEGLGFEVILLIDGSKEDILDACRNNPLPGASRSGARGLTVTGFQPPDSIIVYSAEAGTTAQDGLFTPTLIKYMKIPGPTSWRYATEVKQKEKA